MTTAITLDYLRNYISKKGYLTFGDEVFAFMNDLAIKVQGSLIELNNKVHTPSEIVELMKEITASNIDNTFRLFPPFYTDFGKNTHIGKNVFINMGCKFQDQGGIYIGDNCLIGHNATLVTINHDLTNGKRDSLILKPIILEERVWLGANVTILPGITIGHDAVVGAGSVVTKDVPPNTIVAGNPAKVIRKLTY